MGEGGASPAGLPLPEEWLGGPLAVRWAATARAQKAAFALRALGWKHGQRPQFAVHHGSPEQTY